MHLPHPLLTLPVAVACWWLVGLQDIPRASHIGAEARNPLAICRSAYGSLVARLMKDSLHNYWHAGCADKSHGHPVASAPAAVAAPGAGRFARRSGGSAVPAPVAAPATAPASEAAPASSELAWVDRFGRSISRMEHMRTVRNSPFAVAPTHKRFLSASADWRVHIAWQLDPGDAALYEIDHFTAVSRANSPETAKRAADDLAHRTIQHALSPQASLADTLTGAGAAINLLNDQLRPGRSTPPDVAEIYRAWRVLKFCLTRHRDLRQQAYDEDWWADIPEVRREEIDSYATMLVRLSGTIKQQLTTSGMLTTSGAP